VVVVRRRTGDDLATLVQLTALVRATDDYPTYLPDDDYHRFLTRPESLHAWVAEQHGRICGHVALNAQASPGAMQVLRDADIDSPIGAVARLLVDPGFRRQGVAGELLQTVWTTALSQQRTPMIEVVESSHAAIAFYRWAGWVELGRSTLSLPDGRQLSELVFVTDK
jgi:GNAT superfamily N-acetyltransferase